MAKIKVVKKLRKGKIKAKTLNNKKVVAAPTNKFTDNYLQFYDDIKIPSRRYDW